MPATRAVLPFDFTPVRGSVAPADLELVAGGVVGTVEAARVLNVSKKTLYALMRRGELPFVQSGPGCRRAIPVLALRRYLAERLRR